MPVGMVKEGFSQHELKIIAALNIYEGVLGDEAWSALGYNLNLGDGRSEQVRLTTAISRLNAKLPEDHQLTLVNRGSLKTRPRHFPVYQPAHLVNQNDLE